MPGPFQYQTSFVTFNWMLIWLLITAVPNALLIPMGIDYSEGFLIISSYYLLAAFVGARYYQTLSVKSFHRFAKRGGFVLAIMTFTILASEYIKAAHPITPEKISMLKDIKFTVPLFDFKAWISKFSEIVFQQTFISAYLEKLKNIHQNDDRKIIFWFCGAFTAIHLPLFIFFNWNALYFIIPSFFAGLIFSTLIVKLKNGVLWSYATHLFFYILLGVYWRYFKTIELSF